MKKKGAQERHTLEWFLLCLSCCFMMCFFAPMDAYFANKREFWFSAQQLLPVITVCFFVALIGLFVLCYILDYFRLSYPAYAVALCLLVFFYIQGNYVPRQYGVLNGADINWEQYSSYGTISIVLATVCLGLCLLLISSRSKVFVIGKYITLFLIVIQFVTIGVTWATDLITDKNNNKAIVVTDRELLNLSEDNNVIVFVLDSFDSSYFSEVYFNNQEKYNDVFANFTYYPDTLGAFPATKAAMPQILTGKYYKNDEPYQDYVARAYIDNETYTAFQDESFSLGVYTSDTYLSADPGLYINVEAGKYTMRDYKSFADKIYRLCLFNYMPHQLKKYFFIDTAVFSYEKKISYDLTDAQTWQDSDQKFNTEVLSKGISAGDKGNVLRLYHLTGTHDPWTFDEQLVSDSSKTYTALDEATGDCTLLNHYFNALKDAGIYDKSTIIIMADHGHVGKRQNPLFMIKNVGEKHAFSISNVEVSYDIFASLFQDLAHGVELSESYFIQHINEEGRLFYTYVIGNEHTLDHFPDIFEMTSTGVASDPDNLVYTGVQYVSDAQTNEYTIGTRLLFTSDSPTGNDFFSIGLSNWAEKDFTWTNSPVAMARFKLIGEYDDLILTFNAATYLQQERVIISANDANIADIVIEGSGETKVPIPGSCIENDELILKFEFLDAVRPSSLGNSQDDRELALSLRDMTILSTSQSDEENPKE